MVIVLFFSRETFWVFLGLRGQPDLKGLPDTEQIFNRIMSSLTSEQRICITLRYIENMNVPQIASFVGISNPRVQRVLTEGEKQIRTAVRELEYEDLEIYGMEPLTFFCLLIQSWQSITVKPDPEICNSVLSICSRALHE